MGPAIRRWPAPLLCLLWLAAGTTDGCRPAPAFHSAAPAPGGTSDSGGSVTAKPPVERVLEARTSALMAIPGVIGTGQGSLGGEPVILVLVVRSTAEIRRRVPERLDGYRVVIRETGEVRALPGR
jgi:hypothetical protein